MAVDKLAPNDPRVARQTFTTRDGKTYHYILSTPARTPRATVLLLHGWPDLAFGWRYQVPFLTSLGLRVIVPDLLGYARTSAPADLASYSFKSVSADVMALVDGVLGSSTEQIVAGGHDWGGFLVWRLALWHPHRVRAVFSVCSPYTPPSRTYLSPEDVVRRLPNFTYQLQLASGEVERHVNGADALRGFFNGVFGGHTRGDGKPALDITKGVLFDNLDSMGPSPLLSGEEVEVYVDAFKDRGLRAPLNWYRTRRVNYEEELELVNSGRCRITMPSLFVLATRDPALPPAMSQGMERHFDRLDRAEVDATHWALVEKADEVNAHIGRWLQGVLGTESEAKI